jgi:hypothetical protein
MLTGSLKQIAILRKRYLFPENPVASHSLNMESEAISLFSKTIIDHHLIFCHMNGIHARLQQNQKNIS